jgi:hypothetical protein
MECSAAGTYQSELTPNNFCDGYKNVMENCPSGSYATTSWGQANTGMKCGGN